MIFLKFYFFQKISFWFYWFPSPFISILFLSDLYYIPHFVDIGFCSFFLILLYGMLGWFGGFFLFLEVCCDHYTLASGSCFCCIPEIFFFFIIYDLNFSFLTWPHQLLLLHSPNEFFIGQWPAPYSPHAYHTCPYFSSLSWALVHHQKLLHSYTSRFGLIPSRRSSPGMSVHTIPSFSNSSHF